MDIDKFVSHFNTIGEEYEYLKNLPKIRIDKNEDDTPWKLFNQNGKNNIEKGVYMTLRCGFGGVYQIYNVWDPEKQQWLIESADGSYTIMYKTIEPYLENKKL